jgi:hypothetical protein
MYQINCYDLRSEREWLIGRIFNSRKSANNWLLSHRLGNKIYHVIKIN